RTEVPVKVYKQPTPDLIDSVSCGPLLLDAGSGNGFEYIWSNGNTSQKNEVIASGKYLVTVTNGECTATDSAVVTVNPVDTIHVTWFNDSLFATKGSWVSYKWFVDGFELTGVNQNHIRVTQDGLYEVLATDANGCTDSDTIRVLGYVPVVSLGDEIGLHIYPNPNKGVFRLESDIRGATRVRIINAFGQVVLEKHVQGARQEFDLSGLPKGVYVLQIGTESFARMRFLIQ
ncbi:MAG: T9SS type A sorting domain-containing protein, partial [Flavobacteriales bacterium]|nr:T9SS type A sorting domain-containing protein [Flavobacteriales bacterium]